MFKRILTEEEIAKQIAWLINTNNRLNKRYNINEILSVSSSYLVETLGSIVVGCVQVERQAYVLSEIKHLVVHLTMRRQGLAKILIASALNKSTTPVVYATVREDNIGSQKAFTACGFTNAGKYTTENRSIILFLATSPKWKNTVDKINSSTYNGLNIGGERAL